MTTAPHMPAKAHSSDNVHHRPKGILKNNSEVSVPTVMPTTVPTIPESETKDITLQNTLQNAGPRRLSSARPGSSARRQSAASVYDDNEPRLKWDEANLYLTEQERTAKMKIDEPKTPYAPHYDPTEDDEEMQLAESQDALINSQGVIVDELDRKKVSEDEIPEFELGEPEESPPVAEAAPDQRIYRDRSMSNESAKSEKHVHVGTEPVDNDDGLVTTDEAKEKHRKFEKQRKMHYEMRNIKELLAHPEDEDEDDEMTGA
ncbi:hypothetical protein N7495_006264 [Penicillium taxi]|uniref:uncharacterized protein n=1 Tax=Penicillium taxi TaxID=168475 RepID=UPI002544DD13|nr:uncharacterized protein N7495_006264 [Penicillium taxi]KAJ5894573.1 hypothetical protein N7495_006264 [Penicillium taxi]